MRRPERRNRSIGISLAGYKKSNWMRVPESWRDKHGEPTLFWSRVEPSYVEKCSIGKTETTFLYEAPRNGFAYGCSPSDVSIILNKVVDDKWGIPDLIIFRQPTRKQAQQAGVWGRFLYLAEVGKYSGTAIVLEAQELGREVVWPRKLNIEDQLEFQRLKGDGHVFSQTKRGSTTILTESSVRSTILYRTLIHELGHFRHYQDQITNPKKRLSDDPNTAEELYWATPSSEKEAYAHRFADEWVRKLRTERVIPFQPKNFILPSS